MSAAPPVSRMSLADRTRRAAREHPFVVDALRAGVVNYAAAARYLDVDGDTDAVATALNRFAADLDASPEDAGTGSVRMHRGVSPVEGTGEGLLSVGEQCYAADGGRLTGLVATGDPGPLALERTLGRLRVEGIEVAAAGVAADGLAVVVEGGDGAAALRILEDVLQGTTRS